jgi:hypothetical protein
VLDLDAAEILRFDRIAEIIMDRLAVLLPISFAAAVDDLLKNGSELLCGLIDMRARSP